MDIQNFISSLCKVLNSHFQNLPKDFYSTFKYTTTGNNLTHPITLGLLVKYLESKFPDEITAIDSRFNSATKFQPDITILNKNFKPILFVDYESPNSSDARVPWKDVDAYIAFRNSLSERVPYLVITTLPNFDSPTWELRWCSANGCNSEFHGRRPDVRNNPFTFWYGHYMQSLKGKNLDGIHFLNISGTKISSVTIPPVSSPNA